MSPDRQEQLNQLTFEALANQHEQLGLLGEMCVLFNKRISHLEAKIEELEAERDAN